MNLVVFNGTTCALQTRILYTNKCIQTMEPPSSIEKTRADDLDRRPSALTHNFSTDLHPYFNCPDINHWTTHGRKASKPLATKTLPHEGKIGRVCIWSFSSSMCIFLFSSTSSPLYLFISS